MKELSYPDGPWEKEAIDTCIVGFRYWLWPPLLPAQFGDYYRWGGSFLLWGTLGMVPWASAQMNGAHMWGEIHSEPFERCFCGVHAFTRWRERPRLKWFDQWPTSVFGHEFGLVGGAIIAWGRVAEHGSAQVSEGFRAEHARILALGHPGAARLYRVPFVPEKSLELYASEFGVRLDELHQ